MKTHGIILFGHGARDPRWAEPFERLAATAVGEDDAVLDAVAQYCLRQVAR
jgi:sirohydrochlorin ferrochelatase